MGEGFDTGRWNPTRISQDPPLVTASRPRRGRPPPIADTGWLRDRVGWVIGETLAWGAGPLATPRAHRRRVDPTHRRNVLEPGFRRVGIGVTLGAPVAGAEEAATHASDPGS
jgi:hypothetical protein